MLIFNINNLLRRQSLLLLPLRGHGLALWLQAEGWIGVSWVLEEVEIQPYSGCLPVGQRCFHILPEVGLAIYL